MSQTLALRNRHRVLRTETALLRRLTLWLLKEALGLREFELGIHLVGAKEMARVNWDFLRHEGSTDVITFDHAAANSSGALHGELFICLDDALAQAREFGTTWPEELVRYIIHGVLHLRGHDDLSTGPRRLMKREEGRLLRLAARQFPLRQLARRAPQHG